MAKNTRLPFNARKFKRLPSQNCGMISALFSSREMKNNKQSFIVGVIEGKQVSGYMNYGSGYFNLEGRGG